MFVPVRPSVDKVTNPGPADPSFFSMLNLVHVTPSKKAFGIPPGWTTSSLKCSIYLSTLMAGV